MDVKDVCIDLSVRLLAGRMNMEIIGLFDSHDDIFSTAVKTRGISAMLIWLSHLELNTEPRVKVCVTYDVVWGLARYLHIACKNNLHFWEDEVLKPMNGDTELITGVAVQHLQHRHSLPANIPNRVYQIAHIIMHMNNLCTNPRLYDAFITHHSIRFVVAALSSLLNSPLHTGSVDAAECINGSMRLSLRANIWTWCLELYPRGFRGKRPPSSPELFQATYERRF